jgi:8-amino-7-oxononanoate synthase
MKTFAAIQHDTRNLEAGTSRTVEVQGKSYLFFGGTAYLGLNQHPGFTALVKEGIDLYGLNNGTSRTNNIQLGIYNAAEAYAAERFGFRNSILLSSGYLAAQLAVRYYSKFYSASQILYSPSCHPALWLDQAPGVTGTFEEWARQTVDWINHQPENEFLVISNTVDNVQPRRFDFSPFLQLSANKKIHFILDDSHGIGVFHPSETTVEGFKESCKRAESVTKNNIETNAQTSDHTPAAHSIRITVLGSLAKGIGIDAGIILSDHEDLDDLRSTGFYMGASPTAPAFLHAFMHAEQIYEDQWRLLHRNIERFTKELSAISAWQYVPNYPVFLKPNEALFDRLLANNILITSFPYPTSKDPVLDRIVLSAAHEEADIEQLLSVLNG